MEAKQPDPKHWDIFCRIVDNFGDIGVCWRLSRQLAHEHAKYVRLFIDDLKVAAKLIPGLQDNALVQQIDGVEILTWAQAETAHPATVVLETFGCELPTAYLKKMASAGSVWINVEYLSAESWVNDFHAQPSRFPTLNLTKYFFFPGFTAQTGGLLRERDLIANRNTFVNDAQAIQQFWQRIGINQAAKLNISLFAYPQANVKDLLAALMQWDSPVNLLVPHSSVVELLKELYPQQDFTIGSVVNIHHLSVHVLPFLTQVDYDCLLWACDVNFVRGEDSWIRAIWAGKPFFWQPYIQTEDTHLVKLDAFLQRYTEGESTSLKATILDTYYAWSSKTPDAVEYFKTFFAQLAELRKHAERQSRTWAAQADLASKLVIFSEKIEQNQV
jgi:uncharacterized repeat protein (TIGR03837 family)